MWPKPEAGLLLKLFSLANRGVKLRACFGTNMCFIPQKTDNQNCRWEQKTWLGLAWCATFWLSAQKEKIIELLVRWFLYHSQYKWLITCRSVYGRLLSYMFMLNRLFSMFLCMHSLALLHCASFCVSAFTSCLVCKSKGLDWILALMEMCVVPLLEGLKLTFKNVFFD